MALDRYKVPTPKVKPSNMTDEEWAKIMSQSGVQMPLDGTQQGQLRGAYLQNQYGANTAPVSAPAVPTGTTPTTTTAPAVDVKPYEDSLSNYQMQMPLDGTQRQLRGAYLQNQYGANTAPVYGPAVPTGTTPTTTTAPTVEVKPYEDSLSQLQLLGQNRKESQQIADVTRQRLEKYLPSLLNSQGLGGLGVSETAGLQIYNDYMNTMGQIDRDYNTNKMAVVTGQQEKTYDSIQNMIEQGYFPITSDLERYLNQNKRNLNETQWNELQRYLQVRKTDPTLVEQEEAYKQELKELKAKEEGAIEFKFIDNK